MTLLLENPLPIWTVGIVCTAVALVYLLAKRTLGAAILLLAVIAVTLGLVALERYVVTESEEVEQAVAKVLAAIQANDLPAVLTLVSSEAPQISTDANALMPQVKVRETGSTTIRVELHDDQEPHRATAFFRGRIDGVHARSGARVFYFDQVEIDWQKTDGRWQIVGYRVKHQGKLINPLESFHSGRASH